MKAQVVIIGGGPAGCTCALYTSRADLKTVILDKNPAVGALAITHQIANYPGVSTEMSGEALLDLMRNQAIQYGTDYRRAQVFGIDVNVDIVNTVNRGEIHIYEPNLRKIVDEKVTSKEKEIMTI